MDFVDLAVEFAKQWYLPLAGIGGSLTLAGIAPRVGPGRAAWIALRTRFAPIAQPLSIRHSEVAELKNMFAEKEWYQQYLVVTGEKGVGKSCLIRTASNRTAGVIKVKVASNHSEDEIINNVLQQLTNIQYHLKPLKQKALRVIYWHKVWTLGKAPIVIVNATERKIGSVYAPIAGAVRTLIDDYTLRVVVDGSPNSLDESLLKTGREVVTNLEPMTKSMIWKLPQLRPLFQVTNACGLDEIVWKVFGGIPSHYETLFVILKKKGLLTLKVDIVRIKQEINEVLCDTIAKAAKTIRDASVRKSSDTKEIIDLFDKESMCIRCELVAQQKFERANPDKVFREVVQNNIFVLIPASNAIGIALKHNLQNKPSVQELHEFCKEN